MWQASRKRREEGTQTGRQALLGICMNAGRAIGRQTNREPEGEREKRGKEVRIRDEGEGVREESKSGRKRGSDGWTEGGMEGGRREIRRWRRREGTREQARKRWRRALARDAEAWCMR